MNTKDAVLISPNASLKDRFLGMANDFQATGDDRYLPAIQDFASYLVRLDRYATGKNLEPDRVPSNEFWLFSSDRIIGRSSLRHQLTPALEIEGGHIGYDIRPSHRRQGYGTLILKLTLEKAEEFGLARVLLTCDADNVGSAKIIENNGGVLIGEGVSPRSNKPILQFRIEI